jgi:hypothetical protein
MTAEMKTPLGCIGLIALFASLAHADGMTERPGGFSETRTTVDWVVGWNGDVGLERRAPGGSNALPSSLWYVEIRSPGFIPGISGNLELLGRHISKARIENAPEGNLFHTYVRAGDLKATPLDVYTEIFENRRVAHPTIGRDDVEDFSLFWRREGDTGRYGVSGTFNFIGIHKTVPEPAGVILVVLGLGWVVWMRWKRVGGRGIGAGSGSAP